MKKLIFLFLLTVTLAFALGFVFGQEADLSGTWVGSTYIANSGDDEVMLVLKKEGEAYYGTVSDSMGLANESKLENGKYVDGETGNLELKRKS